MLHDVKLAIFDKFLVNNEKYFVNILPQKCLIGKCWGYFCQKILNILSSSEYYVENAQNNF